MTGQRESVKVFGCVSVYTKEFSYRRDTVFNAETYLLFLEQLARKYFHQKVIYIQDNASYHKDKTVWEWFKENRRWWNVFNLPPYCPELNATERLWHHTRISGTHNRYFKTKDELNDTLTKVFRNIQRTPQLIEGYLRPFQ